MSDTLSAEAVVAVMEALNECARKYYSATSDMYEAANACARLKRNDPTITRNLKKLNAALNNFSSLTAKLMAIQNEMNSRLIAINRMRAKAGESAIKAPEDDVKVLKKVGSNITSIFKDGNVIISMETVKKLEDLSDRAKKAKTAYSSATSEFKSKYTSAAGKLGPVNKVNQLVNDAETMEQNIGTALDGLVEAIDDSVSDVKKALAGN